MHHWQLEIVICTVANIVHKLFIEYIQLQAFIMLGI